VRYSASANVSNLLYTFAISASTCLVSCKLSLLKMKAHSSVCASLSSKYKDEKAQLHAISASTLGGAE
jgi:hypothetical protein